jgi:membrane-bound ClpP family serine protease
MQVVRIMTGDNTILTRNIRTIVNIVLALIIVGVLLWLIDTYIPMAGSIKGLLNLVVVIASCVFVLQATGLWSYVMRLWNNVTKGRFQN